MSDNNQFKVNLKLNSELLENQQVILFPILKQKLIKLKIKVDMKKMKMD